MEAKGVKYQFTASVLDLYLFDFYDLLNARNKLTLRGDAMDTEGQHEMRLDTPADIKKLVKTAMKHRVTYGTKMNENSSRSHAIAQIRLMQYDPKADALCDSFFLLVDLAGSER